jgi:hypothetical protein
LGQTITDRIYWMIIITKYVSFTKYAIESYLGLKKFGSVWSY